MSLSGTLLLVVEEEVGTTKAIHHFHQKRPQPAPVCAQQGQNRGIGSKTAATGQKRSPEREAIHHFVIVPASTKARAIAPMRKYLNIFQHTCMVQIILRAQIKSIYLL